MDDSGTKANPPSSPRWVGVGRPGFLAAPARPSSVPSSP